MSPSTIVASLPAWLRDWVRYTLLPVLGLEPQVMVLGALRGIFDTLLLLLLGSSLLTGGRYYMDGKYTLPRATQAAVLQWAPLADHIARQTGIPREVPLVLWYKENSMQAVNPDNCTGIMGAYDLVRSGEASCFEPGPISDLEVSRQLAIGAVEFKKRCPDINYYTQSPALLKQCYFAYNAGVGAAAQLDPDQAAYVMNGYDAAHSDMVYSDVELGTVTVSALGAWPTHLAMQSLLVTQLEEEERPLAVTLVDISSRLYDWASYRVGNWLEISVIGEEMLAFPEQRDLSAQTCLDDAHLLGRPSLRPRLNPVTEAAVLTQDTHGCSYSLPGVDISSNNSKALLQAPMPGAVTTYTDRWYNSTIRLENDEWIVWLLHPRSYLVEEGSVKRGDIIGVMGAVGFATGPHVHYTIYDKVNETFVDPGLFLPQDERE